MTGFKSGSFIPLADAMTTAPRLDYLFLLFSRNDRLQTMQAHDQTFARGKYFLIWTK
jgi:hypothetical protein